MTIMIAGDAGPVEVEIEMELVCSVDPFHPRPMAS